MDFQLDFFNREKTWPLKYVQFIHCFFTDDIAIDSYVKLQEHNRQLPSDSSKKENNCNLRNETENSSTTSKNSATECGSFEEMLIAAVQERPPLWNYKDCTPGQRTNAAKNKLWLEIVSIINPNLENPEHTVPFLKTKWKSLYDTYRSYIAKEKTKSGQSVKPRKLSGLWIK